MVFSRPRSIYTIVLSALAVLVSAGSAAAQQRTIIIPVDSLARVRVTQTAAAPERFRGTFVGADSQMVVVRSAVARYEVPLGEIRKLEVSRGERSVEAGAWRGAQRGFVGGLLVSAVLGGVVLASENDDYVSDDLVAGVFVVTGTTAGTVLGTLVGALFPGERWEKVPLPR